MNRKFDCTGEWWQVGAPANRFRGRLVFVPGRKLSLSLYADCNSIGRLNPDVLVGWCAGEPATLTDISYAGAVSTSAGVEEVRFVAEKLMLGQQFEKKDFGIRELTMSVSRLEGWLENTPFEWKNIDHDDRRLMAAFTAPEAMAIAIPCHRMTISFVPRIGFAIGNPRRFTTTYVCSVRLTADERRTLTWFDERMAEFLALLTLFMREPIRPVQLSGRCDLEDEVPGFRICLPRWTAREPLSVHPHICSVYFRDIVDEFPLIVNSWFAIADRYKCVWAVLVDSIFNPHQFEHLYLMNLVQALEGLHRRDFDGSYLPEAEYTFFKDIIVNAIPENAPSSLRQALKARLEHGNEYSLRKRLRELVRSLPTEIVDALGRHAIEQLPDELTELRNYWAHCLDTRPRVPTSWAGMLSSPATALLAALVLRKIGVPDRVVINAVQVWG